MTLSANTRHTSTVRNLSLAIVVLWFLLALSGSQLGVFNSGAYPQVLLGLAAVAPVALFGFLYLSSGPFREFLLSLNVRALTLAQTVRVVGLVFLLLYYRGTLPGAFAIPAGWGDIAIGITAPIIAWAWKPPYPTRTFVVWSILGILDLVMAVSLGILSSAGPLGVLAADATTQPMGTFPLSLIPTFFVPLLLIFHLISLLRVRNEAPGL